MSCSRFGRPPDRRYRRFRIGHRTYKAELAKKSGKTVNNILSVLNVLLRTAQEWSVIGSQRCTIKVVRTTMAEAAFHGFEAFDRLVQAARATGDVTYLIVLLGGEAGL